MAVAKVTLNGVTLMDVTDATASGSEILSNYNAYIADGTKAAGSYVPSTPQTQTKSTTPTLSSQTIEPDPGYYLSSVTVAAMPTGTAGTPTATKGTVSNHSVSVTPSVTNTTGYISGGTKTGTSVTVSASELVSGSQTVTDNGTVNCTNLASVVVAIPIQHYYTGSSAPSSSLGADGDIYLKTS